MCQNSTAYVGQGFCPLVPANKITFQKQRTIWCFKETKFCLSRLEPVGYDASQLFAEWQVQIRWAHPDTEGNGVMEFRQASLCVWVYQRPATTGAELSGALKVRVHPCILDCMRLPWQLQLPKIYEGNFAHTKKKKKKLEVPGSQST